MSISTPPHTDSPYHDVSGLPESYMEQVNVDDPNATQQQHLSHSYDDGLQESGYSTPNSRNRRVIREIIVWETPRVRFANWTCPWLNENWVTNPQFTYTKHKQTVKTNSSTKSMEKQSEWIDVECHSLRVHANIRWTHLKCAILPFVSCFSIDFDREGKCRKIIYQMKQTQYRNTKLKRKNWN